MRKIILLILLTGFSSLVIAEQPQEDVRTVYMKYKKLFEKMEGVYPGTAKCVNGDIPLTSKPPYHKDNCIYLMMDARGKNPRATYLILQLIFKTQQFKKGDAAREFELEGWPVLIGNPDINPGVIVHN